MPIDIEVLYGEFTESGIFLRVRVPLDHFKILKRTNVVAVILSADARGGMARTSLNAGTGHSSTGTSVERIGQSDLLAGHVIIRRKKEVTIFGIEENESLWINESDPFSARLFRSVMTHTPTDAVVFSPPDPPLSTVLRDNALTEYNLNMY